MKKILLCLLLFISCLMLSGCNKQQGIDETKNYKDEDLVNLVNRAYQDIIHVIPLQETKIIEKEKYLETLSFKNDIQPSFLDDIDAMVFSSALKINEPYTLTLIKVSEKAKISEIKEEIANNVNLWRWFETGADLIYANNYGSVIIVITGKADLINMIHDEFAKATNNKLNEKIEKMNDEEKPSEELVSVETSSGSCPVAE